VNVAAFLAQAVQDTIQFDACDENSWDSVGGLYPISNACGQFGQTYQDAVCSAEDDSIAGGSMSCSVDETMVLSAHTHAFWYGAPQPLYCGPTSVYPSVGYWDPDATCHNPWADPPKYCSDYSGQTSGREVSVKGGFANSAGRTDVAACCYWGRGVLQTPGVCTYGKLNFYLGARAASEGRDAAYPDIDFCRRPDHICNSTIYPELKWTVGLFQWLSDVQSYVAADDSWSFVDAVHDFADAPSTVETDFVDSVSGISFAGCHSPPCSGIRVHAKLERSQTFATALEVLGVV